MTVTADIAIPECDRCYAGTRGMCAPRVLRRILLQTPPVGELGHFRADFLAPVGAVNEIAFLVDFHGLARYGNRAHVLSPLELNVDLLRYSQDWTVGYSAARSTNPPYS